MKVLLIGNGGREHALLETIKKSPLVKKIYSISPNGGMAKESEAIDIPPLDINKIANFAESAGVDLTVVGPERPLVAGIVDEFKKRNLLIFGPNRGAARFEGSKAYTKEFCHRHGIPQAAFKVFNNSSAAKEYVSCEYKNKKVVIKADGLAEGKGVKVCEDEKEASFFITSIMNKKIFGDAGNGIVVEEYLSGFELSYMVLSDGKNILPLETSRDYKRAFDNDMGPNTGGMGAYSPSIKINERLEDKILSKIIYPTCESFKKEGIEYRGVLYAGLMVKDNSVKLLEYNVRFGDPETQVILPRLDEDFVPILIGVAKGNFNRSRLSWKSDVSVCVVLASEGYPEKYETGFEITNLEKYINGKDIYLFHAGTKFDGERIKTNGGRVMGVTATGKNHREACNKAYDACKDIDFKGKCYRRDIAKEAI